MNKNTINIYDNILDDITFDELITTIQCNELKVTEAVIKRVFNELLESKIHDAKYMLNSNIDFILKQC